jgi:hypothetical protein
MKNVTTYVGIDAHKKNLFVAMLIGREKTPVTWQLAKSRMRCVGWSGRSSARHQARSVSTMKRAPAATRCHGR